MLPVVAHGSFVACGVRISHQRVQIYPDLRHSEQQILRTAHMATANEGTTLRSYDERSFDTDRYRFALDARRADCVLAAGAPSREGRSTGSSAL